MKISNTEKEEQESTVSKVVAVGDLIRFRYYDRTPTVEIMAEHISREDARTVANMEMYGLAWCGPRQVLFVHRDGFMEIWHE